MSSHASYIKSTATLFRLSDRHRADYPAVRTRRRAMASAVERRASGESTEQETVSRNQCLVTRGARIRFAVLGHIQTSNCARWECPPWRTRYKSHFLEIRQARDGDARRRNR